MDSPQQQHRQPQQDPQQATPDPAASDPISGRPFKRPKLKIACQECRDRKVRCDGKRPVCDACVRKQYGPSRCVYAAAEVEQAQNYVKSLEKRLEELESRHVRKAHSSSRHPYTTEESLPPSQARSASRFPTTSTDPQIPLLDKNSPLPRQGTVLHANRTSYSPPSASRSAPIHQSSSPRAANDRWQHTRSAASDMQNEEPDNHSSPFLGSSSAVGFMKEVYGSFQTDQQRTSNSKVDTPHSSEQEFPAAFSWFYDRGTENDEMNPPVDEFLLPPRNSADALLQSYFEVVHHEMPIFYKPAFFKRYERLWTASSSSAEKRTTRSEQLFHCMLDILFALGYEFRPPSPEHNPSKRAQQNFIKRASRLLSFDVVSTPSLHLVQTLVLMARYLQHKGLSNRCWLIVGMAIRAAQGIGLHLDVAGESQAQREERRRTWCACVTLDRVQSMTFGRPSMLSNYAQMCIPQMVDDEYLTTDPTSADGHQPNGAKPTIGFFIYALKLSDINANILRSFYNPNNEPRSGGESFKGYSSILEFDTTVQDYCNSIPSYLRYHQSYRPSEEDELFPRQASLLQIRILHTRILVFRVALVHFATNSFSPNRAPITTLQRHFVEGCVDGCVSAAQELIELIRSIIGTKAVRIFAPPPWYTTFLMYTAGTVLVVVLRAPPLRNILASGQLESIEHSWTACIGVLEEYHRIGVAVAQKCIETLRKVHEDGETERRNRSVRESPSMGHYNIDRTIPLGSESVRRPNVIPQSQQTAEDNSGWVPAGSTNADVPDLWWANLNMDWINNLVEFGQMNTGNGYYESGALQ